MPVIGIFERCTHARPTCFSSGRLKPQVIVSFNIMVTDETKISLTLVHHANATVSPNTTFPTQKPQFCFIPQLISHYVTLHYITLPETVYFIKIKKNRRADWLPHCNWLHDVLFCYK
jgi:hypothetical protein